MSRVTKDTTIGEALQIDQGLFSFSQQWECTASDVISQQIRQLKKLQQFTV